MTTKLILQIALAVSILLVACVGLAKVIDRLPAAGAAEQALDQQALVPRGIAGDELFGAAFLTLDLDRTDVPWQAPGSIDPDHVRAF